MLLLMLLLLLVMLLLLVVVVWLIYAVHVALHFILTHSQQRRQGLLEDVHEYSCSRHPLSAACSSYS